MLKWINISIGGLQIMKEISPVEVQEMLESGEQLNLVDVREDDEVAQGIIPGAIHIPLGEVVERVGELDKSKSLHNHLSFRRTQWACNGVLKECWI